MRLKKNVLRLLSCVAVMAAMVMLLLTGCDGGGEDLLLRQNLTAQQEAMLPVRLLLLLNPAAVRAALQARTLRIRRQNFCCIQLERLMLIMWMIWMAT